MVPSTMLLVTDTVRRMAVALHIHDAELAALFNHEPIFRHNASQLPVLASTDLFQAPTAAIWATKYRSYQTDRALGVEIPSNGTRLRTQGHINRQSHRTGKVLEESRQTRPMLNSWAALSGIGAMIIESRHSNLLTPHRVTEFEADLMVWYTSVGSCCKRGGYHNIHQSDYPFCLKPLWHYTFMTLTADLGLLELVAGKEGPVIPPSALDSIRAWILSTESKRCLLHALFLQRYVASSTMDSANALYLARIVFSAALCWYCYMIYLPWAIASSTSKGSQLLDEASEYVMALPETRLLRPDGASSPQSPPNALDEVFSDLRKILGANRAEMKAHTLCVLESSLRRLGPCGISRQFADLIQAFITREAT